MNNTENESRNHHYVAQCLLKNFSKQGKDKQVFVFDKSTGNSYTSAIRKAAHESDFNVLEINGEKINFEEVFQKIDTLTASITKKIIHSESLTILSEEEIYNLIEITLVQLLRTKLKRTSLIELSEQLRQWAQQIIPSLDEDFNYGVIGENEARLIMLSQLSRVEELIPLLSSKTILLLKASKSKPFLISDNPVVLYNNVAFGDLGLASKGIEIYFPVSSTLCIAFLCPSIILRQKKHISQLLNLPLTERESSLDSYTGLIYKELLDAKDRVELINKLQVSSSSRFLYGSNDDFSIVNEVLNCYPELRSVKGQFRLNTMGKPLPKNIRMPPGDVLVAFGVEDYHIVSIQYIEDKEQPSAIKFFAENLNVLKKIQSDSPFEEVIIYRDGQPIRGMREVEFGEIDHTGKSPISIRHINNEANLIINLIDEHRKRYNN